MLISKVSYDKHNFQQWIPVTNIASLGSITFKLQDNSNPLYLHAKNPTMIGQNFHVYGHAYLMLRNFLGTDLF